MNPFLQPHIDMDGSNEEQVQGIVWFQNTVMALLGYSQMGSERLYQIEDNIDSLKADLSILFKQLTDNNKELSAKQNKILDNAVKLMNKTEGLLDRIEKFTSERFTGRILHARKFCRRTLWAWYQPETLHPASR